MTRVDARTNVTRHYRVGHRPLAVAAIDGTIFVGLGETVADAAARVSGPNVLRAAAPDFAFAADPVSLHGLADLSLGQASGSGLMAAVTGEQGTTAIEPELARGPPSVSRDGRTYTFRLRDGLRFSSGEPVTGEAVRHSLERAVAPELLNHYCRDLVLGDVAGQDAYSAGTAERIAGIEANGDRVAITLVRPSPTLPARLANPCLAVVPAGTPTIPVGLRRPIPSAGPYQIESVIPGQQIVLRRNPRYGGPRPQPLDGLVLRGGIAAGAAGTLVERGRADFAADPDAPPSPDFAPGGRYEREFGSGEGRLRYVRPPSGGNSLLLFNTRRGIFSSPELRRAVNLAIDRAALWRASGGGAAQPADHRRRPGLPRSARVPAARRPAPGARAGRRPRWHRRARGLGGAARRERGPGAAAP